MSWTTTSPTVSPSISPSHTAASSPTQSRRVHQRRGSTTATDPWGAHIDLNMNPGRTTSCKLTIVRVNPTPQVQLDERPPSPQHRRHFGLGAHSQNVHRRHVHTPSHGSTAKPENTRMSFASASFAPGSSNGSRSSSPTHGHSHRHNSSASKPRLSADQIVTLAQQSCHPQSAPSSPRTPGGGLPVAQPTPASFTAIPDDVFLPFVDRADEVKILFTSPQPGARLFALLAQTFPLRPASDSPVADEAVFNTDPRQWSSTQLEYWMKQVDRDIASDEIWVGLIRRCILSHSELIWERIKGALGVPPELDPNDFEQDPFTLDHPLAFSDFEHNVPSEVIASPIELHPLHPEVSAPRSEPVSENSESAPASVAASAEAEAPSPEPGLSIEPVLMATSPSVDHDHPPTRLGAHRMHDISEDVQGESDDNEGEARATAPSPPREIIQGLRISTVPASPGLFASDSSSVPTLRALSMSSVSQSTQVLDEHASPLRRSGSMSSTRGRRWSYATSNTSSEGYDVVGERGPGNPLFPTSFARLALGPTLTANNPALRSPHPPPAPAFSNPDAIRAGILRGRRGVPSWAEGWDPSKHEYAITGSESSVGGF
ncbi:hypothetical protein BC834DRAFT_840640 [Gloeopeniophorella convolvens]|nr:hypothetical protein BC834DRAFT_840640 [Gloeopeniophorella convolvens]